MTKAIIFIEKHLYNILYGKHSKNFNVFSLNKYYFFYDYFPQKRI